MFEAEKKHWQIWAYWVLQFIHSSLFFIERMQLYLSSFWTIDRLHLIANPTNFHPNICIAAVRHNLQWVEFQLSNIIWYICATPDTYSRENDSINSLNTGVVNSRLQTDSRLLKQFRVGNILFSVWFQSCNNFPLPPLWINSIKMRIIWTWEIEIHMYYAWVYI